MTGYMKVIGAAKIKAAPDTATVNLGVVTENASLEAARNENAAKTNSVINQLNRMGIPNRLISTSYYNVEPIYDYINGQQTFKGYRVTNILTVTVTDISTIGQIIDSVISAGANRVDSISFSVGNSEKYYDKALGMAVKNAMHKAFEIGSTLKVQVFNVPYKIIERSTNVPLFEASAAKLSAAATPVLPGELEITAAVEVTIGYRSS